jgi:hypothetical protein
VNASPAATARAPRPTTVSWPAGTGPTWIAPCTSSPAPNPRPRLGRSPASATIGSAGGAVAWDVQHAVTLQGGPPAQPLDGTVAAAGIEEFLTEFLPGLLAGDGVEGLAGTLHLHATDGESEWWIDLDARADAVAVAGHAKADTAIRGTRSDLLLWLTNRAPSVPLEVLGRADVAARWAQLQR